MKHFLKYRVYEQSPTCSLYNLIKMPKDKKKQKVSQAAMPKLHAIYDIPSENCKNFLIQFIVKFYEENTIRTLESKYVRYRDEGPDKFKMEMTQRMMNLLHVPEWIAETEKKGYLKFVDARAHDALWNAKNLLAKYGRQHCVGDEAFNDVLLKADLFVAQMRPFAKNRNRCGSVGWWNSEEGRHEDHIRMAYLIAIPPTARVINIDNVARKGGYATICRVRIEGAPGILPFWEFAAKLSNQWQERPDLAKVEHQNESMAVRIPHPGVIRFVAIHADKYEGYTYWWNGGTLREMLNRDYEYGDDVFIHLHYGNFPDDEVIRAHQLVCFRKKRTELAWALLHIMNEVHKSNNLHNDLSPDNILLHFPLDESQVFIGVCDWGMTTKATEPMQSLYTFTNAEQMAETLRRRWWVDPRVLYLHKQDADVQIIPKLSRALEEFATARIAQRINGHTMSKDYEKLQRESQTSVVFSNGEFANTFHMYMDRVCNDHRDGAGGLSHIITRFSDTYHWPTPHEHFRTAY